MTKFLEDLHAVTGAVVRVDGEVGRSVTVKVLAQLPPDKQFGVQITTKSGSASLTYLISRIVALMFVDNFVLLADPPDALLINAAKTEIVVVEQPMASPTFKLSSKELLVTDSFKYLGPFFADDWSMSRRWMSETSVHWPHFVSFRIYGPAQS
eukprot:359715-Chlamydomonas_euryale.AAC.3